MPRALGGGAARDRLAGGLEQRLVVEQGEVGVEDRRLGVARAAGDRLAVALDRLARGGDRLVEALALALGRRRRRGRAAGRRAAPRWRAGPMATPAEAATPASTSPGRGAARPRGRPAPARRGAGGRRARRPAAIAVAEALVGQRAQRRRAPRRPAGPMALTSSVSPKRAPSATTLVRLVARTGAPPPSLATRTSAS